MGTKNPKNFEDVTKILDLINTADIQIARVNASLKEEVARARKRAEKEITALKKKRTGYIASIRGLVSPLKKSLLKEWGTKSKRFGIGIIGWRKSREKVIVAKGRLVSIVI